jgi:hypothetical protein
VSCVGGDIQAALLGANAVRAGGVMTILPGIRKAEFFLNVQNLVETVIEGVASVREELVDAKSNRPAANPVLAAETA